MRSNIRNLKGEGSPIWTLVWIILSLALLFFLIYFAVTTGGMAKLLTGKIL